MLKLLQKIGYYILLLTSIAPQVYVLFVIAVEAYPSGIIGIAAPMVYGTILPISFVSFFFAWAFSIGINIWPSKKFWVLLFFGLHLVIVMSFLIFPSKFAP